MSRAAAGLFTQAWSRRSIGVLGLLAVCAPVFVWATERTGYAEPLDVVSELTGASTSATVLHEGLMPGYTVSGLDIYTGTLVAALVGTGLTLGVTIALGTLLEQ